MLNITSASSALKQTFMHPILRTAIAVMLGMLIALMAMFLADRVNAYYFPSDQLNRTHEQIAKDIQSLPLTGFLLILAGFFFCGFFGAYTAARLSPRSHKAYAAGSIGFFLILISIVFFLPFGLPIWFAVCSLILFIGSAWLAYQASIAGLPGPSPKTKELKEQ